MQTNAIIHNIIRTSENSQHINLLYDNVNSLFDNYCSGIDGISYFGMNDGDMVTCDLIFSNNPISLSTKLSELAYLHLNSVAYFHTPAPHAFKKEDKFLLKNTLNNTYKIFANKNIINSWGFENDNNVLELSYGLKTPNGLSDKTRSVVVMNTNNNPSVYNLYKYISEVFKDAVIITDNKDSKALKALQESVVCV